MKLLATTLLVLATLQIREVLSINYDGILAKCTDDPEIYLKYDGDGNFENSKFRYILLCIMSKIGVVVDGKLQVEPLRQKTKEVSSNLEAVDEVVNECVEQGKQADNDVDIIFATLLCLINNGATLGFQGVNSK